jgi:hypothetical protein
MAWASQSGEMVGAANQFRCLFCGRLFEALFQAIDHFRID